MISREETFFLKLIGDYINGRRSDDVSDDINCDELYRIAHSQSLAAVCYVQLKELDIETDAISQFHKAFLDTVYSTVNLKTAMEEFIASFNEQKIEFIPFKGWTVKNTWPHSELRTMGDIDVVIHHEDRNRSDQIMFNLGYSKFVDNHAVWTYTGEDAAFELHDHMFYEHLTSSFDYIGYFDRVWDHFQTEIEPDYHYLYLITHLAKHITNHGIGFREFIDLIFFADYYKETLHWERIRDELEKMQLLEFAETCIALNREWFGAESPFPVDKPDPEFFRRVTEKIFADGIFGFENSENSVGNASKEIRYSGSGYWKGAFLLTLRKVFPAYRDMQLIPWYSWVDGKPWLLPAAWVYRWFYVLTHKFRYGLGVLTQPVAKKKQIDKRSDFLKQWGL